MALKWLNYKHKQKNTTHTNSPNRACCLWWSASYKFNIPDVAFSMKFLYKFKILMINFKEQASIVLINQPTLLTNMAGKNIRRENHLKRLKTL